MKQALHRKLSAFLRLGLAALLFLGNIALVVVLVALLETKGFWIYAALQAASVLTAGWVLSRRAHRPQAADPGGEAGHRAQGLRAEP